MFKSKHFGTHCSIFTGVVYEDGTDECFEMLEFKLQMPVDHPEESMTVTNYFESIINTPAHTQTSIQSAGVQ
jgi:hypothetical protein